MSILINGMEMPTSLGVSVTIYPDGRVVDFHGSGPVEVVGKAVSVPPHGDLIDRDAYCKQCKVDTHFLCGDDPSCEFCHMPNAPTIIESEE